MTRYTDPEMEDARKRGYEDGIAGRKCRWGSAYIVTAYLTGHSEGTEKRDRQTYEKRVENLKKARRVKWKW